MSAVRAVANADSWSLSTGFKQYFSCCFSKTERSTPATGKTKAAPDAPDSGAERVRSRRSSAASKSDDDDGAREATDGGGKVAHRRLEADGASVHSTSTDKANSSAAGDRLSANMTSSHPTGAICTCT